MREDDHEQHHCGWISRTCGKSGGRRGWTARTEASAERQLPRRRQRRGSHQNPLAHRFPQRARLRGRVISATRSTWCLGASLAGGVTGLVAADFGWRVAVMVPGVIALLAIYVRATCPESPYWVRAQDRKQRISETLSRGGSVSDEDRAWFGKAKTVGIRQAFLPDVLPAMLVALFVACCSTCILGTVGGWMPLYLATQKHWSTAEYSLFYVFWGLSGFLGLCVAGWLADKIGRRLAFVVMLIEGAIFLTLWVLTDNHVLLWAFGLAWSFGFLGFLG